MSYISYNRKKTYRFISQTITKFVYTMHHNYVIMTVLYLYVCECMYIFCFIVIHINHEIKKKNMLDNFIRYVLCVSSLLLTFLNYEFN